MPYQQWFNYNAEYKQKDKRFAKHDFFASIKQNNKWFIIVFMDVLTTKLDRGMNQQIK